MIRTYGRAAHELRPIQITYNVLEHAAGSVLFTIGKTKVICAVTLQPGVPHFLKGKRTGWLNAEYAMLPVATHVRKEREIVSCRRNGRSIEISRFIGRSLRSVLDLTVFGERTLVVDCDVLQADGGTRTAAITGSFLALRAAIDRWLQQRVIDRDPCLEQLGAISLGLSPEGILLDLDFVEDSAILADFNFVITQSGSIVEVQGAADQKPISWDVVASMYTIAYKGITDIFSIVEDQKNKKKPFNKINIRSEERSIQ